MSTSFSAMPPKPQTAGPRSDAQQPTEPSSSAQGKIGPERKRKMRRKDDSSGSDCVDEADYYFSFSKGWASLLDCPFHKYDPARYQSCQGYSRFCDLEMHLKRQHVLQGNQLYCPRCRIEFPRTNNSIGSRDRHVIAGTCEPTTASDTGVLLISEYHTYECTLSQMGPKTPPEAKWSYLWLQIFNSNPPSPYVKAISPFSPATMLGSLLPGQRFELPGDFIQRVPDGLDSHPQQIISAKLPMTELARRVRGSLFISKPIHVMTPLELGLYKLAKKTPLVSHLVDRVGQGAASRGECDTLERIYAESDDYALVLANSSPFAEQRIDKLNTLNTERFDSLLKPLPEFVGFSKLEPPVASEQDVFDIPLGTQPSDNPDPPSSGRRDDSHNASHPEDSGYGSIAETVCLPVCARKDAAEKMVGVADDDARTIYSNVTNEDPLQTRDFVHELASDIYGKLKRSMGTDDWPIVSESLPELLKAFAIKIGSNGASQASRDAMYFIHKEHRNITNRFKSLLLGPVDDGETARVDTNMETMSLQDKMAMWDEKISVQESAPENSELFQNVTDDDSNMTASLLYNKMVLESKDYPWLVQRLETELSLERSETNPSGGNVSIRQQIISMLPPSNISKRRRPTQQVVVFQFPSRPIRFLASDPILVTPSSHNLQLTNILAYVKQTWPLFGEELLSFINRAFGHPHLTATIDSSRPSPCPV